MSLPIELQHPTLLAPMEGISHPTYRQLIAEKGGVGMVCTEFVRIQLTGFHEERVAESVVRYPGVPLSVQVMGREACHMASAASVVENAGADVVDINLGCPSPKAVRGGVGAAMLKDLPLLNTVLSAMRSEVKGILSAKIRAGFDDKQHVEEIARCVQDAGVDFITVHPRRRIDRYLGVADWRIIAHLKNLLHIPVVGNGDIWCAADALRMEQETGCDAVMMGRGALRNPWIFSQLHALREEKEPFLPKGSDVAFYFDDVHQRFAPLFVGREIVLLGRLKELWGWTARAFPEELSLKKAGLRTQNVEAFLSVVRQGVAPLTSSDLDLSAHKCRGEKSGRVGAL
ncbi:MAG: tRNA-dihydrouridine synthase family protein [Deltaproteobacteria bacterium]|nr:tRNA-dihydrouridine synthase family protein [Deltaproteobacteria bacterium]